METNLEDAEVAGLQKIQKFGLPLLCECCSLMAGGGEVNSADGHGVSVSKYTALPKFRFHQ
jgi:hypothetical protein